MPEVRPEARIEGGPRGPLEPLGGLAEKTALDREKAALSAMSRRMGLARLSPEERTALGVTGTGAQLRRSLSCLQLLQARPDLSGHLPEGLGKEWEEIVGARLFLTQLRRCLAPALTGAERADLCLRAEITADNDAIEDHFAARLAAGPSDEARRRLQAKFDDPARVRQFMEEGAEERKRRRGRREAVKREAETAGWRLVARELSARRLREGEVAAPRPPAPRDGRRTRR